MVYVQAETCGIHMRVIKLLIVSLCCVGLISFLLLLSGIYNPCAFEPPYS